MSGKTPYNKGGGGTGGTKPPDGNNGKASNNQQSRYQRQMQGKQGQSSVRVQGQVEKGGRKENVDRTAMRLAGDAIDAKFGFNRMTDGPERFDQSVLFLYLMSFKNHFIGSFILSIKIILTCIEMYCLRMTVRFTWKMYRYQQNVYATVSYIFS